MTLLLVTGCYKDEFGQIQKEIKNLQDSQIAPLEQQLKAIQKSHSELNILSDELREYVALLEEASKELEGNIGKINEKIQELKQSLNDKNVKEKGEVLARLENAKTYLEGQLSTMKSTVDVLKDKYDGIQAQMDAMDALLADKYATKDWVSGTFATIEQQNALIAEVEAVKVLANELNATALKIESDVKTYMAELRESTLGTVDSSISAQVGELTTAYESAIGTVVANVTAAFNSEIESAINTSESGIMSWVDEALKDYLTTAEAEAKLAFYKGCIGAVPDGESLQSQIDDLGALIDGIKPEIEAAYKEAIKKAIEESEGKLTKELTGEIESIKLNELKLLTDGVSELGDDVTKLWEDLGKLEDRIKTLEDQVAAINATLAVILGETAPTLEEYISALNDELRGNDDARTAYLKNLVADLQNAVDGKDNDKSLQSCIEDIKTLLGTLPAGETSIVEWVQSSKTAIDLQLKSYATIAYVDGLRDEIDSATTDHSNRLDIISGRLDSAIDSSKSTICSWISKALADYMRGADFEAKLQTLVDKYEDLFSKGDQGLQNQINTLSISVKSAIAELQEAYKTKIDTCITEYNSYVVDKVDKKYKEVKDKLDADSTNFDALEATIDGMKKDVKALNVSIDSLRKIVASLDTFVYKGGYTSLKGIVRDFDAKLKGLTGIYADLKAFNAANDSVNKVGGYKESIEKLADFKKRLEEAEAAIANYKNLAKDFDLDGTTLKEQFNALNTDLGDLKTAVFGSSSLRSQLEAIVAKDTELASAIDALNTTLLSRLQSYTSIAFRPSSNDGSATFTYDAEKDKFSSTLNFDVRPKALASSIASNATVMYVLSPTRSLVNLFPTTSEVTSPGEGQLSAVVTLPGNLKDDVSKGMSLALFAKKGTDFDFASEFIPVSGDRMFLSNNLITCDGYGTRSDVTVSVYFPDSYTSDNLSIDNPSSSWVSVSKTKNTGTRNGLRFVDCTVSVKTSKDKDANRTAAVSFSVGSLSRKLTCTLTIIQDPREIQEFVNFNPADGKIKFSWKGYVIVDTLTNIPTNQRSQTITVTTGDALTDWEVEPKNTPWVTVSHDPDLDELNNTAVLTFEPGDKNANYNQSGTDKTGYLTFTSATGSVFNYSFTQLTRPQQRLEFDPDTTVGLTFGYSAGEQDLQVTTTDGESTGWDAKTDQYNWITFANGKVSVAENPDTTARTGYIEFETHTGKNDTTYRYPIHQEAAPKQSFTFGKVTSGRVTHNYDVGADGLIHIYQSGGNNNYVYVKGVPSDSWTMRMKNSGTWLTREDPNRDNTGRTRANQSSDFDYIIHLTAGSNNNIAPRVDTIVFTMKNGGAEYFYEVWQDGREPYRFTDLSDKEYDYKGQTSSFDVTTDPSGNKDWNVKVLDTLGNDVTSRGDFWLKVANSNNGKASLTLTENGPEKDRKAKVIFYTFEGIEAESADTITVTQTKKPAQKFTFSVSERSTAYCYIGSEDGLIHVKNGGNNLIYVIVTGYPNNSDWTVTYPSNSWISRNGGNSNGRNFKDGHNYIQFKADENDSGVRTADLTFNVDGKSYTYTVYQDARSAQKLKTQDPKITFSWDGKKYKEGNGEWKSMDFHDSDWGSRYDYYYHNIIVETEDSTTDWSVAKTGDNTDWMTMNRENNSKTIELRAAENDGSARSADLTFTLKGGSDPVIWTFNQETRPTTTASFTIGGNPLDKIILSWDGKSYKKSYQGVADANTTSISGSLNATINVEDGSLDWKPSLDPSSINWIGVKKSSNLNEGKYYITVSNIGSNPGSEIREAAVVISIDGVGEVGRLPIVQDARPALSVSVRPDYVEIIREYNSSNRKYRTSPSGEWTDVKRVDGERKITLTVETIGGGPSDWDIEYRNPEWASVTRDNGVIYIKPKDVRNDDVQQKDSIIFKDKAGNLLTTYHYYKETRPKQTFTDGVTDKVYEYYVTENTFNVSTSDGLSDWYIKCIKDEDGTEKTDDPGYWIKAEKVGTSVKLTMSVNNENVDRKATINFISFGSGKTITVTQKARPAQTFKSFSPNDIDGKTYSFAAQSIPITVETSDGRTDWTVSADGTGISVVKGESDNFATLILSKNQSETDIIKGSITFTSHGGSDERTFNFTQDVKPETVTLSIGTINTFDFVGGYVQKLTVNTTPSGKTEWTVEKKKLAGEDNEWLSFEKVDGGVNVSAALNTGSARSTGLLFKSPSGEEYPVTVSQEAVGTVTLTFGETTWSDIDGNSDQEKTVSVTSSHPHFTEWDVKVNKESYTDFLTAKKSSDGKSVTLKASKNGYDAPRSATVTFISNYEFVEGNTIKCSQTACLAAGTKITMADGSLKKVEDIVEGDLVRTFNHEKGQMDAARICLTYKGGSKATPLTLSFASGKKLSIVGTHDLLSQDTRKYVRINRGNVASFIGKSFYNAESGQWDKLIGYKLDTTPVDYYCIYTTNHLNCIAEGMLTVPDDVDYFLNIYELDANLKADLKQLAADIKQYGLMDPRKDYPQYPELQALGESLLCKYLYIALAKGYVTEEEFTMLLEAFVARWS